MQLGTFIPSVLLFISEKGEFSGHKALKQFRKKVESPACAIMSFLCLRYNVRSYAPALLFSAKSLHAHCHK
jgi:hypothetical protein